MLLSHRGELLAEPTQNVLEKNKLQLKIDDFMEDIKKQLDAMSTILASQRKNKKKNGNIEQKAELLKLYLEKYDELKAENEGEERPGKDAKKNENTIAQLEVLIQANRPDKEWREMTEEEKNVIAGWKSRLKDQEGLEDAIIEGLKKLKQGVKEIGLNIEDVGKKMDKLEPKMDKTTANVETVNKKLKTALEKFRSSDKFCVDIVLLLICLGLAVVLYSIIKNNI